MVDPISPSDARGSRPRATPTATATGAPAWATTSAPLRDPLRDPAPHAPDVPRTLCTGLVLAALLQPKLSTPVRTALMLGGAYFASSFPLVSLGIF